MILAAPTRREPMKISSWLRHAVVLGGALWLVAASGVSARQAAADGASGKFVGEWRYNRNDSVNAATGRPELGPQSATSRRGAPPSGSNRAGGPGNGSRSGDGASGASGANGPQVPGAVSATPSASGPVASNFDRPAGPAGPSTGYSPEMMRESRDLQRDLTEVAQSLTIKVTPAAVTFVDDLGRERTYPTDGSKQKYQLGASQFEAEVEWADAQLHKRIQGSYGFRMNETYFLSPDGRRLFVIVRVGEPKKDGPIVGFNRVYDRVD